MKTKFDFIDRGRFIEILKDIVKYDTSKVRLLDTTSVTIAIKCNRLQSLILCEERLSYSIQSQRYCRFDDSFNESIILNGLVKILNEHDEKELYSILYDIRSVYIEMTEIKEGHEKVTKKTKDDFKYGIPVEDARSILPMAFTANHVITMSGLEFLKMIATMDKFHLLFEDLKDDILSEISRLTNFHIDYILQLAFIISRYNDSAVSESEFKSLLINPEDWNTIEDKRVMLLNEPEVDMMTKSGIAALTCTSNDYPTEILMKRINKYGDNVRDNLKGITERVTYDSHHTSISEHASMTWLLYMTIGAYNQYVRHRHHKCFRCEFEPKIDFEMPETIKNSEFNDKVQRVIAKLERFIKYLSNNYTNKDIKPLIHQLIPMGHKIKIIANSNLINEFHMGEKRNCNNAQDEIRHISNKKLKILIELLGADNKLVKMLAPGCIQGRCPEGKGACKDNSNVKNYFNIILKKENE